MRACDERTRLVARRALDRCEYCRMHQALQGGTFHVGRIHPLARNGADDFTNLALACPGCNLRKADRVEALDPETGAMVALFHPRHDPWSEHFRWEGHPLVGRTPRGRATVAVLDLNHPRRLLIREAEPTFGLFPPLDSGTA
jgi:hypothetical protein